VSVHKSLKLSKGMARTRNVYTRWERLLKLKEDGRWTDESQIFGLPKVRVAVVKIGKKKKKKGPEEEEDKKGKKK